MYEFARDGVILASALGVGPGNGDEVVWVFGKDLAGLFSWLGILQLVRKLASRR
jgi:hypothetical protein